MRLVLSVALGAVWRLGARCPKAVGERGQVVLIGGAAIKVSVVPTFSLQILLRPNLPSMIKPHLVPKLAAERVVGAGPPGVTIAALACAIVGTLRPIPAHLRVPKPVLVLLREVATDLCPLAHGRVHKVPGVRLVGVYALRAARAVFAQLLVAKELAVQGLVVVVLALVMLLALRRVPKSALVLCRKEVERGRGKGRGNGEWGRVRSAAVLTSPRLLVLPAGLWCSRCRGGRQACRSCQPGFAAQW